MGTVLCAWLLRKWLDVVHLVADRIAGLLEGSGVLFEAV